MKTVTIQGSQAEHTIEIRDSGDNRPVKGMQWLPERGGQHWGFNSAASAHRYAARMLRKKAGWPDATKWVIFQWDTGASLYLVEDQNTNIN